MSEELSVPLPATGLTQASTQSFRWLRAAGIVLAGSALAAMTAHVAVPLFFTPVPLTLQPFAVLLLGLLLTPGLAAATFAAYLLEGAAGLPVFAPGPAAPGLAHLFGPTGGYLLAYPLAAALISFLWRRGGRGFAAALVSAAAGDAAILACGGLWLGVLTHGLLLHAVTLGVLPFLPGDALKIAAAAALAAGFVRLRRRSVGREDENTRPAKSGQ
ncbi:MAG TPA: biotin transporter BioY [Terracidiphilus sp.]|jgi:biotin transport system substrate-specific component